MWTLSCRPQTPRIRTAARDVMIFPATWLDILQTEVQLGILTRYAYEKSAVEASKSQEGFDQGGYSYCKRNAAFVHA